MLLGSLLLLLLSSFCPKVLNVNLVEQTIWKAFRDIDLPQCLLLNLFIFYSVETTRTFLQPPFLCSSHSSHQTDIQFYFVLNYFCLKKKGSQGARHSQ